MNLGPCAPGNHVFSGYLSPFALGNYVSTRKLGPFALGNYVFQRNLDPFPSSNYISLRNLNPFAFGNNVFSRNLGPFAVGNCISIRNLGLIDFIRNIAPFPWSAMLPKESCAHLPKPCFSKKFTHICLEEPLLPWGGERGDLGSFASRNHVSPKEKH